MADPTYKFTVQYSGSGFGPSESWYRIAASPEEFVKVVNKYMALRALMLPSRVEIAGVRIGQSLMTETPSNGVDNLRQSAFYPQGSTAFVDAPSQTIDVPLAGNFDKTHTGFVGTIANVSANIRVHLRSGRNVIRYLVWPVGIIPGPDKSGISSIDGDWLKLFDRWRKFVGGTSGAVDTPNELWVKAIVPSDGSNTTQIAGWQYKTAAPDIIGFSIQTSRAGGMTFGAKVHIRGVRRRPNLSAVGAVKLGSLNGKWIVESTAPDTPVTGFTTVFLRGTQGFDPLTIKIQGTAQLVQYRLYQADLITLLRLRTHKRGKDQSVPRGRRLTRLSADP